MDSLANHLDWIALVFGAVGSLLWAHNGRSAKYASLWWLLSSLLWVAFAWVQGLPALGVRDAVGVGSTLYGCFRWLQPLEPVRVLLARLRPVARA
ncbi:MAG TPA: hypothetical protein VN649_20520 [Ramlibacter sp.]|nr:hypothetical protein [Ramlibacter sp.]